MKQLNCSKCRVYLGTIEKGKIKKGTKMICKECDDRLNKSADLPPGFDQLFGGFNARHM